MSDPADKPISRIGAHALSLAERLVRPGGPGIRLMRRFDRFLARSAPIATGRFVRRTLALQPAGMGLLRRLPRQDADGLMYDPASFSWPEARAMAPEPPPADRAIPPVAPRSPAGGTERSPVPQRPDRRMSPIQAAAEPPTPMSLLLRAPPAPTQPAKAMQRSAVQPDAAAGVASSVYRPAARTDDPADLVLSAPAVVAVAPQPPAGASQLPEPQAPALPPMLRPIMRRAAFQPGSDRPALLAHARSGSTELPTREARPPLLIPAPMAADDVSAVEPASGAAVPDRATPASAASALAPVSPPATGRVPLQRQAMPVGTASAGGSVAGSQQTSAVPVPTQSPEPLRRSRPVVSPVAPVAASVFPALLRPVRNPVPLIGGAAAPPSQTPGARYAAPLQRASAAAGAGVGVSAAPGASAVSAVQAGTGGSGSADRPGPIGVTPPSMRAVTPMGSMPSAGIPAGAPSHSYTTGPVYPDVGIPSAGTPAGAFPATAAGPLSLAPDVSGEPGTPRLSVPILPPAGAPAVDTATELPQPALLRFVQPILRRASFDPHGLASEQAASAGSAPPEPGGTADTAARTRSSEVPIGRVGRAADQRSNTLLARSLAAQRATQQLPAPAGAAPPASTSGAAATALSGLSPSEPAPETGSTVSQATALEPMTALMPASQGSQPAPGAESAAVARPRVRPLATGTSSAARLPLVARTPVEPEDAELPEAAGVPNTGSRRVSADDTARSAPTPGGIQRSRLGGPADTRPAAGGKSPRRSRFGCAAAIIGA
jgi:hypothetical protein